MSRTRINGRRGPDERHSDNEEHHPKGSEEGAEVHGGRGLGAGYATASLRRLPAENFTAFFAGILIVSPVVGLRP